MSELQTSDRLCHTAAAVGAAEAAAAAEGALQSPTPLHKALDADPQVQLLIAIPPHAGVPSVHLQLPAMYDHPVQGSIRASFSALEANYVNEGSSNNPKQRRLCGLKHRTDILGLRLAAHIATAAAAASVAGKTAVSGQTLLQLQ